MDIEGEEEPEWKPFGFHSDDYDTRGTPMPTTSRGNVACTTPACICRDGQVYLCRHHEAGPKALLLLRNAEDYLRSLRGSPQRDRLLKDTRALLDQAGVR